VSSHPPHPALRNHVHRFDPLRCPPRTLKRAVALCQPGPFLYRAVVLFHNIIKILAWAQADTARQNPFRFQLCHCRRKGWVLVHIDDSRHWIPGRTQSLTEEAFRSCPIALGSKQKFNGLASRIHSPIQELVLALNLYICLVDAVTLVCRLQMLTTSLAHLWRIQDAWTQRQMQLASTATPRSASYFPT
jgi:hypothetical protein